MRPRPHIDVSALPTTVFGPKAPLWWGAAGLFAIESTLFALLVFTYYYLRGNESITWDMRQNVVRLGSR